MLIYKLKWRIIFSRLIAALVCASSCSKASQDITYIDIDNYNESKKRIVIFNIKMQKFLHIGYFEPRDDDNDALPVDSISSIKVSYNGNMRISDNFEFDKYICRTVGKFEFQSIPKELQEDGLKKILQPHSVPKGGEQIFQFLHGCNRDNHGPRFQHYVYTPPAPQEDQTLTTRERGLLGELATEMTMLSFGCRKLPSQNKCAHGFDGVYVTSDKDEGVPHLFLTESKYRKEKKTSSAYMQAQLNEVVIYNTLINLEHPDTINTIEKFIKENPDKIYKLVHRIKSDGEAQCYVEKFNLTRYHFRFLETLEPRSSEEQKIEVLRGFSELTGANPQNMLELVLKQFGLSAAEGASIILMHSLSSPQQQNIRKFLPLSLSSLAEETDKIIRPSDKREEEDEREKLTTNMSTSSSSSYLLTEEHEQKGQAVLPSSPTDEIDIKPLYELGTYKPEKVKLIIELVRNNNNKYFGKREAMKLKDIASILNLGTGEKPLQNILKGGNSDLAQTTIWIKLNENLDEFCGNFKIVKKEFLEKYYEVLNDRKKNRDRYENLRIIFLPSKKEDVVLQENLHRLLVIIKNEQSKPAENKNGELFLYKTIPSSDLGKFIGCIKPEPSEKSKKILSILNPETKYNVKNIQQCWEELIYNFDKVCNELGIDDSKNAILEKYKGLKVEDSSSLSVKKKVRSTRKRNLNSAQGEGEEEERSGGEKEGNYVKKDQAQIEENEKDASFQENKGGEKRQGNVKKQRVVDSKEQKSGSSIKSRGRGRGRGYKATNRGSSS